MNSGTWHIIWEIVLKSINGVLACKQIKPHGVHLVGLTHTILKPHANNKMVGLRFWQARLKGKTCQKEARHEQSKAITDLLCTQVVPQSTTPPSHTTTQLLHIVKENAYYIQIVKDYIYTHIILFSWHMWSRRSIWAHGMGFRPLVRPRHLFISVRPIRNFFMSAVDSCLPLKWNFSGASA